jgi:CHAT domain-containing protein
MRASPLRHRSRIHLFSLALWLIVVGGIGVAGWPALREWHELRALRALVATVDEPTFFGRPMGRFPVDSFAATADMLRPEHSAGRVIAAESLLLAARQASSPTHERHAAVAEFLLGDVADALSRLQAVATAVPADAAIQNDFSVLVATRGVSRNDWTDLARALALAERAHRLNPRLLEPQFNRALLLDALGLSAQAKAAWREFLEREPSKDWRREAANRLAKIMLATVDRRPLAEPLVEAFTDAQLTETARARTLAVREYLSDTLLPQWGASIEQGFSARAERLRRSAERLAIAIDAETGDRFARDITRSLTQTTDRLALARAHVAYGDAMRLAAEDKVAASLPLLRSAADGFRKSASPMALLGRVRLVPSASTRANIRTAEAELIDVEREATGASYAGIVGLVHWKRGLLRVSAARLEEACLEYGQALTAFARAHETENVANVHSLLAEANRLLGEFGRSGSEHQAALNTIAAVWNVRIRHQILSQAAITALALGLPETALDFQQEMLTNAQVWGMDGAQGIAFLQRAKSLAALGRAREAVADLQKAAFHIGRIPDAAFRTRFETELRLAETQVFAESPAQASAAATRAIDALHTQGSLARVPQMLFARGQSREQLGDVSAAARDFRESIMLLEQQRNGLRDEPLQLSLLAQNTGVYQAMAHLAADVARLPVDGLRYIERMHARGLLDALSSDPDPVVSPLDVSRAYPERTFLCYAFRDNDLMTWIVRDTRVHYQRARGIRPRVQDAINKLRAGLASRQATTVDAALLEISRLVLQPVATMIAQSDALVIIPDEELYVVPFAALSLDPADRYIAVRHPITIAPSLSVYARVNADVRQVPVDSDVLVVAPAETGLVALPAAVREAGDVAALYRRSTVLSGREATPRRFLASVSEHAVVHFAGHGVANEEQPAFSRLLLHSSADEPGGLLASDVARERFPRTRLVVLGACESASGTIRSGEGALSVARGFLAAGVPTVVGSLWDVEDDATRRLLTRFHEAIQRGDTPASALRQAQLTMIDDGDPHMRSPMTWAGFVVVGADAHWATNQRNRSAHHVGH